LSDREIPVEHEKLHMLPPNLSRRLIAAACLVALLPGAVFCHAAWSPKTLMQTTSTGMQGMTATAVGPNGDAIAAWRDDPTGYAYAAVRRAGVWGASKPIYKIPMNAPEEIIEVRVSIGGDGTAIAAFVLSHFQHALAYQAVMAATMPPNSPAWSTSMEVSPRGKAANVMLGTDASGDALVMWSDAGAVMNATRPVGGAWSEPQSVPGCLGIADLAMNAAGNAVVVWSEVNGTGSTLRSAARQADGTWLPPIGLATIDGPAYSLHAAIDGQGLAAVAWISSGGSGYRAWLIREASAGVWNPPSALSEMPMTVSALDLGMNEVGDLGAAWAEMDSATWEFRIHGRLDAAGTPVQEQTWVTTDVGFGFVAPPSVAMSPDGTLTAIAWIDDGAAQAYAVTYTAAQLWSAPALIGPGLYENTLALACGPGATACSVWPMPGHREFFIGFHASTFALSYPVPTLTSIDPWMMKLGSGAAEVVAGGKDFLLGSGLTLVEWDGAGRPTDLVCSSNAIGHLLSTDLDTEGVHRLTVRNSPPGGGVSKSKLCLVDGTPPVTQIALSGPAGNHGWFIGPVLVKLTASDALSGVSAITYQLDAGPTVLRTFPVSPALAALSAPKTARFSVKGDFVHSVAFSSADNVANANAISTQTIPIDRTPPTVTRFPKTKVLPAAANNLAAVMITGSITDNLSGVDAGTAQYTVVDEYGTCQPSGPIPLAAGGAYNFTVKLDTYRDAGDLDGRTYTINVSAKDLAGLSTNVAVLVSVK
jgi:hypothetical protein